MNGDYVQSAKLDDTLNMEMLVIGGILNDCSTLNEIDLIPGNFLNPLHQQIYSFILTLRKNKEPIEVFTIDGMIKKSGQASIFSRLIDYQRNSTSSSNNRVYAERVKQNYIGRQIKSIATDILGSQNENNNEVLDEAIKNLMALNTTNKTHEFSIKQALQSSVSEIEKACQIKAATIGLPTGLIELDKRTGGLHETDLIVIGARPAMGKTALLLNMLTNSEKIQAGICSAEQGHKQIGARLISIHGEVNGARLRSGSIDDHEWQRIYETIKYLVDRNVWINDKAGMTIDDIERQARKWVNENSVNVLGVDYIQKIRHTNTRLSTIDRITDISERLKNLAKELNIPVVALAQVNRNVENRGDKRPNMSDIKDCGVIEQEADLVMCLYRDEVYNEGQSTGVAELIIDKNRHGPLGTIYTKWEGKYMKFSDRHRVEQAVKKIQ